MEGRPHANDAMLSNEVDLVFNTAQGAAAIEWLFASAHGFNQ